MPRYLVDLKGLSSQLSKAPPELSPNLPADCKQIGVRFSPFGGPEGARTLDLRIANATLSQLSYRPVCAEIIITQKHIKVN